MTTAEEPSQTHELQNLVNLNSESLLLNFPPIPLNQPVYGCSEVNAQFQFGFSPDFDKKIQSVILKFKSYCKWSKTLSIKKHDLPIYEQISDILTETSNIFTNQANIIDKQPILRRFLNVYFENGLVGLCEDIVNSKSGKKTVKLSNFWTNILFNCYYHYKVQQIPNSVKFVAGYLMKIIDTINAPINPWILSSKEAEMSFGSIKGPQWYLWIECIFNKYKKFYYRKSSLIRAFQWHPHCNKYAVVFKNNIVKVYSSNQVQVILKHQNQVNVTCLAWKWDVYHHQL